jgi:hypothetical protein
MLMQVYGDNAMKKTATATSRTEENIYKIRQTVREIHLIMAVYG